MGRHFILSGWLDTSGEPSGGEACGNDLLLPKSQASTVEKDEENPWQLWFGKFCLEYCPVFYPFFQHFIIVVLQQTSKRIENLNCHREMYIFLSSIYLKLSKK